MKWLDNDLLSPHVQERKRAKKDPQNKHSLAEFHKSVSSKSLRSAVLLLFYEGNYYNWRYIPLAVPYRENHFLGKIYSENKARKCPNKVYKNKIRAKTRMQRSVHRKSDLI